MKTLIDPKWESGPRVRVDAMKKGDQFTDIGGNAWTYVRRDGALGGAHHVVSPSGEHTCFAGCAEGLPVRSMKAPKLPKLSPKEHEALLLWRDNLEGGDPHMGHVTHATCEKLMAKGLIEDGYDANGERRFKRIHIPTALGLAVLDAMTHGPIRPPPDAPAYIDTCTEYGSARLSFQIRVF